MRSLLLITVFASISLLAKSQTEHTYSIDSAKINPPGTKAWNDISDKMAGNLVSVNIHEDKIEIYQFPKRTFTIIRNLEPIKEEKGDTFTFKCVDSKNKTCTIYVAFTYAHKENPTLFVQYIDSNEMYYLKNF